MPLEWQPWKENIFGILSYIWDIFSYFGIMNDLTSNVKIHACVNDFKSPSTRMETQTLLRSESNELLIRKE